MPPLSFSEVGIGFDMFGCPNRCRHCFYGPVPNTGIREHVVRRMTGMFRDFTREGDDEPLFEKIWVSPRVAPGEFRDIIFIEQAIPLGRFGVLTFLYPEGRKY